MSLHTQTETGNEVAVGAAVPVPLRTDDLQRLGRSSVPADEITHEASELSTRFKVWGEGSALLWTVLFNRLLMIPTLGLYYFWGRAKVRRYLWNSVDLNHELFAFHGTGGELLLGWLKIRFLLLPLLFLGLLTSAKDPALRVAASSAIALAMALLHPFAVVGGHRYLMSRSSYREIRFSFRGSTLRYVALSYGGALLCVLSLGLFVPFYLNATYGYLARHSYYGSLRFAYDGKGVKLLPPYLVALLGIAGTCAAGFAFVQLAPAHLLPAELPVWLPVLVLGSMLLALALGYFAAAQTRHCISHTSLGSLRLESTVTGAGLVWLWTSNGLLWGLTLGLAAPWTLIRSLRFRFEHLIVRGDLKAELQKVEQQKQRAGAMGTELAEVGDMDIGWDG